MLAARSKHTNSNTGVNIFVSIITLHFPYCYKEMKDMVWLSAMTVIHSLAKLKDAALRICSMNYFQDPLHRK